MAQPQPVAQPQPMTQPQPVAQPQTAEKINKLNIVNPLNPDEIIKTEDLIENKNEISTNEPEEKQNEQVSNHAKKKNNKLTIILLLIVVIVVLGIVVFFTFFNKPKSSPTQPSTSPNEPVEEIKQITLNDILNNFNNNSMVKQLQETSEINAYIDNNKLVISIKIENQEPNLYEYTLENRNLKTNFQLTDLTANIIFLIITDNIGQFHGTEENETYTFLSSIDFTTAQIDGINYNINNDIVEASINIDKKIDTSSLTTMYIELNDLNKFEGFKDSGTIQINKGNMMLYKYNDSKTTTVIIAEKDNLTNLTYNSILSVIEFLYPNELETFKTSYPELTSISFNRYKIVENPELTGIVETLYGNYEDQYKFIEIKINKSI